MAGVVFSILSSFQNPIPVISSFAVVVFPNLAFQHPYIKSYKIGTCFSYGHSSVSVKEPESPYLHCLIFFPCKRILNVILSVNGYMKEQNSSMVSLSTDVSRISVTT